MSTFLYRLTSGLPLLLDGAMGTELQRRGVETRLPLWSVHGLLEQPDLVREIHRDYIRAGAEIITTNTFRSTTRALGKGGLAARARELTRLAVELAHEARDREASHPVWIAGSVAPLEDCYEPRLAPEAETARAEHRQLIRWLKDAGVDLILVETMNTIREAEAALAEAKEAHLPVLVSFACDVGGRILSGEPLTEAVAALSPLRPDAFLINCTSIPHVANGLRSLRAATSKPFGAYANNGSADPTLGWRFATTLGLDEYVMAARQWIEIGARIIGGCCGTTPEHIRALHVLRDAMARNTVDASHDMGI